MNKYMSHILWPGGVFKKITCWLIWVKRAPLCPNITRYLGYVSKTASFATQLFRLLSWNLLCLQHQGTQRDNVCVWESVNICVWRWKCLFDCVCVWLQGGCRACVTINTHAVVNGLWRPFHNKKRRELVTRCGLGILRRLCFESLLCSIYRNHFQTISVRDLQIEAERCPMTKCNQSISAQANMSLCPIVANDCLTFF